MARKSVPTTIIDDNSATSATNGDASATNGASDDGNRTAEPELIFGFESVEPASVGTDAGSGGDSGTGERKRRGRPPGSGTGTRSASKKSSGVSVETILFSLHFMAANFFDAAELALSDSEAKAYADAIGNVAALYNHNIDPRIMAWGNLALVAGGIYGTRIFAIRQRQKLEARPAATAPGPNVVDFKPASPKTGPAPGGPQTPADLFGGYGYGLNSAIPAGAGD